MMRLVLRRTSVSFLLEEIRYLRRVVDGKNIFNNYLLISDSLVSVHHTSAHINNCKYGNCKNSEISK